MFRPPLPEMEKSALNAVSTVPLQENAFQELIPKSLKKLSFSFFHAASKFVWYLAFKVLWSVVFMCMIARFSLTPVVW